MKRLKYCNLTFQRKFNNFFRVNEDSLKQIFRMGMDSDEGRIRLDDLRGQMQEVNGEGGENGEGENVNDNRTDNDNNITNGTKGTETDKTAKEKTEPFLSSEQRLKNLSNFIVKDSPISDISDNISKLKIKGKGGETRAAIGIDPALVPTLAKNLYSGDLGMIVTKELLQNAVDSIRPLLTKFGITERPKESNYTYRGKEIEKDDLDQIYYSFNPNSQHNGMDIENGIRQIRAAMDYGRVPFSKAVGKLLKGENDEAAIQANLALQYLQAYHKAGSYSKSSTFTPEINLSVDTNSRTISIQDNGIGMTPDVMTKEFVDLGGTFKPSEESSGGYGIAKAAMFFNADNITVESIAKDNQSKSYIKTIMQGSAEDWLNPERGLSINSTPISASEFVNSNLETGTKVEVKLKNNPELQMSRYEIGRYLEMFHDFHNLPINFNINHGKETIKPTDYSGNPRPNLSNLNLASTVKIPGNTLDIYISPDTQEQSYVQVRLLNNGLPQTIEGISLNESAKLPAYIVVDVKSKASPKDANYAWRPDREGLRGEAKSALESYIKADLYHSAAQAERETYVNAILGGVDIPSTTLNARKEFDLSQIQHNLNKDLGQEFTIEQLQALISAMKGENPDQVPYAPPEVINYLQKNVLGYSGWLDEYETWQNPDDGKWYLAIIENNKPTALLAGDEGHFNTEAEALKWKNARIAEDEIDEKTGVSRAKQNSAIPVRHKVIDTNGDIPKELITSIARNPHIGKFSSMLGNIANKVKSALSPYGMNFKDGEYYGIGLGRDYYGVNVKAEMVLGDKAKDLILINPYTAIKGIEYLVKTGTITENEKYETFAAQMLSTLVHEYTHQEVRNHNESFSSSLTRNIGRTAKMFYAETLNLSQLLSDNNGEIYESIKSDEPKVREAITSGKDVFSKISTAFNSNEREQASDKGIFENSRRESGDVESRASGESLSGSTQFSSQSSMGEQNSKLGRSESVLTEDSKRKFDYEAKERYVNSYTNLQSEIIKLPMNEDGMVLGSSIHSNSMLTLLSSVYSKYNDIKSFSRELVRKFGEEIRPYAEKLYNAVKQFNSDERGFLNFSKREDVSEKDLSSSDSTESKNKEGVESLPVRKQSLRNLMSRIYNPNSSDLNYINLYQTPLSDITRTGVFEKIGGSLYGKLLNDAMRNTQIASETLIHAWSKELHKITDLVALGNNSTSSFDTLNSFRGKGKSTIFSNFINLIEMDDDNPNRKSANPQIQSALESYDNLTSTMRNYINQSREALGDENYKSYNISERGYYRNLFLGNIRIFQDGKLHDTVETYPDAIRVIEQLDKTNPDGVVTLKANNRFSYDPMMKVTRRTLQSLLGKIENQEGTITITKKEVLEDFNNPNKSSGYRNVQGKAKYLSSLLKKESLDDFSKDFTNIMQMTIRHIVMHEELTHLSREIKPIINLWESPMITKTTEKGEAGTPNPDYKPRLAEYTKDRLNLIKGVPLKYELLFGNLIRKFPFISNQLANPDMAFRAMVNKVTHYNSQWKLAFSPRAALINKFDILSTLWPYASTSEMIDVAKVYAQKSERERVKQSGVFTSGEFKLNTSDANSPNSEVEGAKGYQIFAKASEGNRMLGYIFGELRAKSQGIEDVDAIHRSGLEWAKKVEFDNSIWNSPYKLSTPIGKLLGQFKGYSIKAVENIMGMMKKQEGDVIYGKNGSFWSEFNRSKFSRGLKLFGGKAALGGVKSVTSPMSYLAGALGYSIFSTIASSFKSAGYSDKDAQKYAEFFYYGMPSQIGIDLSGSLAFIDSPYGSTDYEQVANFLLGPTFAGVHELGQNAKSVLSGDETLGEAASKTLDRFTPYAKNLSAGVDLTSRGIVAATGDKEYKTNISKLRFDNMELRRRLSNWDLVKKLLGFQDLRQTEYYDLKDSNQIPPEVKGSEQVERDDDKMDRKEKGMKGRVKLKL
jgi:hypothetical protein